MKKEPVAKLVNLRKSYFMGKIEVPALCGVNYDFHEGFTVVAGPSGSGKSTLLNIVGCLDKPTVGQVYLGKKEINRMNERLKGELRRRMVGFIFQSFSLIPVLSVFDNVEYPLLRSELTRQERRERVQHLLDEVGIGEFTKRFPRELSGGQMQRVAIARALVSFPKLIIADEPTANLDSKTGERIIRLLERMQREHGASVIIASHDGTVLEQINRQLHLKDGIINDKIN